MSYATYMLPDAFPGQAQERDFDHRSNVHTFDYGQTMRYAEPEMTEKRQQTMHIREQETTRADISTSGQARQYVASEEHAGEPWQHWMSARGQTVNQERISYSADDSFPFYSASDRVRSDEYNIQPDASFVFRSSRIDQETQHEPYTN